MSAEETPKQAAEELQKFYLTRHEWYEARYSVTYEVKAATYEEAVKELERCDETGNEDNCKAIVTDLDAETILESSPLETDDNVIVVLKGDTAAYDERKKELPIKQTYNGVIYSEQLHFVLPYVIVGGDFDPRWQCLGIFRSSDAAKIAVSEYIKSGKNLREDHIEYIRVAEGAPLRGLVKTEHLLAMEKGKGLL